MKKLTFFLAVVALTGLSLSANAQVTVVDSGYCGGVGDGKNLTWKLTSDSILTISGSGTMTDYYTPWRSSYQTAIKKVIIGDSVTSIGDEAFYNVWINSVIIGNNVLTIGIAAFCWDDGLTSITIPNSVTTIGQDAFFCCSGLTSLIIGNSVKTIGKSAFGQCESLTSITIPNSVTSIENRAFLGCFNLMSINVSSNNSNYSSIDGIVYNKMQDTLILCPQGKTGTVVIPNSVKAIGDEAFVSCQNLISINIPNGVTSIGVHAFQACSSLSSVTIGNNVTTIGDYAFMHCINLTTVTIPDNVTSIGEWAFNLCRNLISVTIGNGVTTIGDLAFSNCNSLTSITCKSIIPPVLGTLVFDEVPENIPVYIPCGTLDAYLNSDWIFFTNMIDSCSTGIVETHCNASLRICPNPTKGQLTIDCRDVINHVSTVEIFDVVGRNVGANLRVRPDGVIIDISHLPAGIYFLKIGNNVVKFVKE